MSIASAAVQSWARAWATARPFATPMPRRGAWYPVVGETSGDRIVLEISGRKVRLTCQAIVDGVQTAKAEVLGVRVFEGQPSGVGAFG